MEWTRFKFQYFLFLHRVLTNQKSFFLNDILTWDLSITKGKKSITKVNFITKEFLILNKITTGAMTNKQWSTVWIYNLISLISLTWTALQMSIILFLYLSTCSCISTNLNVHGIFNIVNEFFFKWGAIPKYTNMSI